MHGQVAMTMIKNWETMIKKLKNEAMGEQEQDGIKATAQPLGWKGHFCISIVQNRPYSIDLMTTGTWHSRLNLSASAAEPTMSPQWIGIAASGWTRLTAWAASSAVIV